MDGSDVVLAEIRKGTVFKLVNLYYDAATNALLELSLDTSTHYRSLSFT